MPARYEFADQDQICWLMLTFAAVMMISVGGAIGTSMILLPGAPPALHAAFGFFGGPTALVAAAHMMKTLGVRV